MARKQQSVTSKIEDDRKRSSNSAFPAKAGIQSLTNKAREAPNWTPAFAGDTVEGTAPLRRVH